MVTLSWMRLRNAVQSDGDDFSHWSQSVFIPINRTRGEHHDRYLHLRRLFQPRRLRLPQRRQLGRLLGQARPRAARPPPRLVRSHGSLSMNRALVAAGLVDRVQVTLFPVITGQTGADPIFQGAADFDLELIESRTLDGNIQELVYRPTLHV